MKFTVIPQCWGVSIKQIYDFWDHREFQLIRVSDLYILEIIPGWPELLRLPCWILRPN